MLEDESAQLEKWKKNFAKLLNVNRVVVDPGLLSSTEKTIRETYSEPGSPSVEEIRKALFIMKITRWPGSGGSPLSC